MYECIEAVGFAEVNSSSHKYPNEMTCGLKRGDEAFSLPDCLHEQMLLTWLVRPATTTTDDEASCMLQHLCKNKLCIDQQSV
jgi:hypothetical protein